MGETSKAKTRRLKEGFFEKYCKGKGLDIGCGKDLLTLSCEGWDREQGDAQYLKGVKNSSFDFVYSSHLLEHLENPGMVLKRWYEVLKSKGYFILAVPHRDLYEKRTKLPSKWNPAHKHFFLLDEDDPPDTIGILGLIKEWLCDYRIIYAKICDAGHTEENTKNSNIHSDGEYSIEIVIQKLG